MYKGTIYCILPHTICCTHPKIYANTVPNKCIILLQSNILSILYLWQVLQNTTWFVAKYYNFVDFTCSILCIVSLLYNYTTCCMVLWHGICYYIGCSISSYLIFILYIRRYIYEMKNVVYVYV